MTFRLWLLAGVVLCSSLPSRFAVADEAEDIYSLAVGFYKRQLWDKAADNFRKFLVKYPTHEKTAGARLYGGLALVNLKDYQAARELLRDFVKNSPQNRNLAHAMYRVGECSYLLDDLKAAEPELSGFALKFPEDQLNERALPYLGDVQLRINKPDGAIQTFQKALKAYPNGGMSEDSRFGLARAFELQKQFGEAIKLYQELAANPQGSRAAEAQFNLGSRYFDDKNYAAAAAAYARLIEQFPENSLVAAARLNQGFALYQVGDFRKAVAQFEAAALDPKQAAEALYWKGLSLKSLVEYAPAAEVLQQAYAAHPDHMLAANLLYHWADCEQRLGNFDSARTHFLEVLKRFPKGELADDALHYAAVSAFEAGNKPETEALLNQFAMTFPSSGLRWHQEILRGRLDLLKGDPAQAVPHFEKALQGSETETTKSWARYYLGYAWHQMGKEAEALGVTEPLATVVSKDDAAATLADVLLLRGAIQLALGKAEKAADRKKTILQGAVDSASRYLVKKPKNARADQGLALRALAAVHSGQKDIAQRDLEALKQTTPKSPEFDKTVHELAEVAYANEDWEWSSNLFGELAAAEPASPFYAQGLSGLGWSQYRRKQFVESEKTFAKLAAANPADKTAAPEALFMQGKSLQDNKQPLEAVAIYHALLQKYPESKFGYLAGLEQARLLSANGKVPEANAAYEELLKVYPQAKDLDKILDEWALMNYAAQDYAKSDDVFRRLIKEAPQSDLADNAQLSLAESTLLAGKLEEAQAQLLALEANPKSDAAVQQAALFQLVNIQVERKQWKDLLETCRKLRTRFPQGKFRWYAEFRSGEADLNLLNLPAAQDRLTKLTTQKDNPEVKAEKWFTQVWVLLAETQFRLKQYSSVAATVADLRKWNPKSNVLYLADEALGRSLKAQAMFPEARAAFLRVIDDPAGRRTETAAKSQFMIAETYLLEKSYKTAEEEYLKVEILYKFPEWQAPALFQAAACQEQAGRWAEAVKSYEALLKQYPDNQYAAMANQKLPVARKKAGG